MDRKARAASRANTPSPSPKSRSFGTNTACSSASFAATSSLASTRRGVTGEILLQLLETRLDNVVYRLGFANSRNAARQLVSHGHVQVNGRKVDVSSFNVKPGDNITVKDKPAVPPPGCAQSRADADLRRCPTG